MFIKLIFLLFVMALANFYFALHGENSKVRFASIIIAAISVFSIIPMLPDFLIELKKHNKEVINYSYYLSILACVMYLFCDTVESKIYMHVFFGVFLTAGIVITYFYFYSECCLNISYAPIYRIYLKTDIYEFIVIFNTYLFAVAIKAVNITVKNITTLFFLSLPIIFLAFPLDAIYERNVYTGKGLQIEMNSLYSMSSHFFYFNMLNALLFFNFPFGKVKRAIGMVFFFDLFVASFFLAILLFCWWFMEFKPPYNFFAFEWIYNNFRHYFISCNFLFFYLHNICLIAYFLFFSIVSYFVYRNWNYGAAFQNPRDLLNKIWTKK
ncbi:MAG: hypothetical protein ACD_59C00068G0002 [uncultured bacterium]|nr:MAG: hypothetical protein ACD_59C00068G0002 [uncultured bacterium]